MLQRRTISTAFALLYLLTVPVWGQAVIINHNCVDITAIPLSAITAAKANLHIAYGHTSHGSQVTDGMTGLVAFASGGGKGLTHPPNTFAWNNGGSGGALDLHDYAMGGDCGYYPDWYNNTVNYLNNAANADVNVIIWSWCGQVDEKYAAGTLYSEYINPMAALEAAYPGVTFVYMTGHVDHWDDANNKAANQVIRDYCNANGKVLYDFADIESYDPDGTWYQYPNDNCDYYASATGSRLGNWAAEWQDSHTENVDWYSCGSAHSEPLNANQKAYAAWWLWAALAGWDQSLAVEMTSLSAGRDAGGVVLSWTVACETECAGFHVWRRTENRTDWEKLTAALIPGRGNASDCCGYTYTDRTASAGITYLYRIEEIGVNGASVFHGPVIVNASGPPVTAVLRQNYPNPFNPETTVAFSLAAQEEITLAVYDVRGRKVRTLADGVTAAGGHTVVWDGLDDRGNFTGAGIYLCRLQTSEGSYVRKMVMVQ
ncbi:T9SS type A sorting domain-containing protein [bacterium]|nr:T9SS type A sorting domain-containing protein [bacterium]